MTMTIFKRICLAVIAVIVIILFRLIYTNVTSKQGTFIGIPDENRFWNLETLTVNLDKKKCKKKFETECRRIIEDIFGEPFPSMRPYFLRNPETGKNLELDMFNPYLKLSLEFNGIQHRQYTPFFHKSHNDFVQQVSRDNMKRELCKINGITLIEIPDTVKFVDLRKYITSELRSKYF